MNGLYLLSYFFGGVFAANALPHSIAGVLGRPFQSPFAKPPGEGLSTSTVNVIWGFANAVVAYLLLLRVGRFDLRNAEHAAVLGLGVLLMSLFHAHHFGQFHGGKNPAGA